MRRISSRAGNLGGALLMVLWLSAALSAIAFSVASNVRNEISRTDTALEGMRAYYLACGAADRAVNYLMYGPAPWTEPTAPARWWEQGMPLLHLPFPEGDAAVEVIAESSKFNVNIMTEDEVQRLLAVLGLPPAVASQVAMGILHWRAGQIGGLDTLYLSRSPSFRAPHTSIDQLEELMSVNGITPDLFYGGYSRGPQGGLAPRAGLRDCLSVVSAGYAFDINTVNPVVMLAMGVPPSSVEAIVAMRREAPIRQMQMPVIKPMLGPAADRFRVGGYLFYTLRATARMRRQDGKLSDLRRTVAMTVQIGSRVSPEGFRILAWQDNAAAPPLFNVWPN